MILVVGATGRLGGVIARLLQEQGEDLRLLVRGGVSPPGLDAHRTTLVRGDLKDRGSLEPACDGVDLIVTTANSAGRGGEDTVDSVDRRGNRNLVECAVAAGVSRFVFVSALGADLASPVPFLQAKGETEAILQGSGIRWSVLRPDVFMDVWIPWVVGGPALAGEEVVLVGEGRARHSMIAVADVAAFTVAVIRDTDAVDQTLVLGGPEPVSWRDVVSAFEAELGREVPVRTVPPGHPVPGMPEIMVQIVSSMEMYESPIDMSQLSVRYGVQQTSLRQFVHQFVRSAHR